MKILNFGSANLDYVYQVEHFVRPGETLSALSQSVNPGGKGLNQSIALAKAGAEVYHAGCLGAGGAPLRDLLRNERVDTRYLLDTPQPQGNAVIQVTPQGENSILLFGGSNQCITEKQIAETLNGFCPGDYLLLQNEINALPAIVDRAHVRGMQIVLNPSPCDARLDAVDFGKLAWLFVNEVEAEQLSGSRRAENAWAVLHERYPKLSVLITLGGAGSTAYRVRPDGEIETARQEACMVQAVDTTAAGDTYTGYFLAGLMEGRSLQDCMRRAGMASAICVTRRGAAPSIPGRTEVEQELEEKA